MSKHSGLTKSKSVSRAEASTLFPRITKARHLGAYKLEVSFTNGLVKTLDFRDRIAGRGGVFEPLQDVEYFSHVAVDREGGTLVWPNGVDFCPHVLYAEATGKDLSQRVSEIDVA